MSGSKNWICCLRQYPKSSFNLLEEYVAQTFSGGFTDVHGDKDISAEKRTQKEFSFFFSHSWSKKYYRSSLTVHRDR